MARLSRNIRIALPLAAILPLVGCAARDNDRLTLGGVGSGEPLSFVQAEAAIAESGGAAVIGSDRSAWPETIVHVPMDRVDACSCGSRWAARGSGARHAGRFPKPEEAVELRGGGGSWLGPRDWARAPAAAGDRALGEEQPQ